MVSKNTPIGFYEVVGFKPYNYAGVRIKTATFAIKSSAEKFAAQRGGKVKPRAANAVFPIK